MDNSNLTVAGKDGAVADGLDKPVLPEPVLEVARAVGSTVRWFEQAFEWENLAYMWYAYFWARRATWLGRLRLGSGADGEDGDPLFTCFLQAGYARVLLPVRLGFECAVQVYLCTSLPWLSAGEVPPVGDETKNSLFLDVAEEVKNLTSSGAGTGNKETPVGEPWEYRHARRLSVVHQDGG